ncbi:hypothetical protein AJ87_13095 [Rhizobium yanglingense]|nr:hypothetical protein AJ87_13095 [Rhizobium yanglingense]
MIAGCVLAIFLVIQAVPMIIVQMIVLGVSYNIARVLIDVHVQRSVPDHLLGRTRSQIHTVCVGAGLVTYSLVALIGNELMPSMIFGLFGLLMVAMAILIVVMQGRSPTAERII